MLAAVSASRLSRPRRWRPWGRAAIAVALAGLTGVSAAGCGQFDKALGQQEEVVIFQSNTSNVVKLKVRSACSHIPQVVVEPLPTDHKLSDEIYDVRYEVGSASTVNLARLQQCLTRFRSVVGLQTDTPGGD
jgi:hypothetical protein